MLTIYSNELKDNKELFYTLFKLLREEKLLIKEIGHNFIIIKLKEGINNHGK